MKSHESQTIRSMTTTACRGNAPVALSPVRGDGLGDVPEESEKYLQQSRIISHATLHSINVVRDRTYRRRGDDKRQATPHLSNMSK